VHQSFAVAFTLANAIYINGEDGPPMESPAY